MLQQVCVSCSICLTYLSNLDIFCILQLAESAKAQFAGRNHSDHLALVRAFDGWKDAEREQSGYEYCWRNFLSAQTLRAIDSLRKQFYFLLKDAGLVDPKTENCNCWSHDEHLIRAIICAGLFPGVCSVVVSIAIIFLRTSVYFLFTFLFYLKKNTLFCFIFCSFRFLFFPAYLVIVGG